MLPKPNCCTLLLISLTLGAPPANAATGGPASALVLSRRDLGRHYTLNRAFTMERTLPEVSAGEPRAIKQQLARLWTDGRQSGFNGDAAVGHRAVISTADLFRTKAPAGVVSAWAGRLQTLGHATRLAVPSRAPGSDRVLLRGHLQTSETLIYMWRHGRAVMSTWLVGTPKELHLSQLIRLARRQEMKAGKALG